VKWRVVMELMGHDDSNMPKFDTFAFRSVRHPEKVVIGIGCMDWELKDTLEWKLLCTGICKWKNETC
jgi:hypothetical protein